MSRKPLPASTKKLALVKQTLRQLTLSDAELGRVAGGTFSRTRTTTSQAPPTQDC